MLLATYTSLIPFRNSNFMWFYVPTGEVKENKILLPSNSSKGQTNLIARETCLIQICKTPHMHFPSSHGLEKMEQ